MEVLLLAVRLNVQKILRARWDEAVTNTNDTGSEVDSKEIHVIWSIQVTVFHNGPWVSPDHPVR